MTTGMKWLGGLGVVLLAALGFATLSGTSTGAQDRGEAQLAYSDVLADDAAGEPAAGDRQFYGNDPVAPEDRQFVSDPVVQDTPAYDPENPFVIKRVLPIDGPIRYGEWHWDDEGVPDGPLIMTVDLEARVISVFRDGYEIGAAAALLGTESHPTPTGVFPILTKERHNVSEKYNNAPMPWTLRLTWDGIAIHGGSTVELGYASHGCIGVPDEFVSRLYDIARVGDVVIITDGVRTGVGGSLDHSEG